MEEKVLVTDLPAEERRKRLAADILDFSIAPVPAWYRRTAQSLLDEFEKGSFGNPIEDQLLHMWFADAWSIVRNMHTMAQLIRKVPSDITIQVSDKIERLLASCSSLRNGMDHVVSNLGNLATKIERPMSPLQGTLTAVITPALHPGEGTSELYHVVVTQSAWHHRFSMEPVPPDGELFPITGRVGAVRLHAFGEIVNLSAAAALADNFHRQLQPFLNTDRSSRLSHVLRQDFEEPLLITW